MEENNKTVSEAQIEAWKKKYGEVYEITIPMEDIRYDENGNALPYKKAIAYLKKPDRNTVAYALSVKKNNPLKAKEVILENSFLGGDEFIMSNDELFFSACTVLDELIIVREAELKKK